MKKIPAVLCLSALMLTVAQPVLADSELGEFRVWLNNGEQIEGNCGLLTDKGLEGKGRSGRKLLQAVEGSAAFRLVRHP